MQRLLYQLDAQSGVVLHNWHQVVDVLQSHLKIVPEIISKITGVTRDYITGGTFMYVNGC